MQGWGQHWLRMVWRWGVSWVLICGLMVPAQASWEAHQRAGEEAVSQGHYAEARQQFLAAVREAREEGLQGAQLDISLRSLAHLNSGPSRQSGQKVRRTRRSGGRVSSRRGVVSRRKPTRQERRKGLRGHRSTRPRQALGRGRSRVRQRTVRRESARQTPQRPALQRSRRGTRSARRGAAVARRQRTTLRPRTAVRRLPPAGRVAVRGEKRAPRARPQSRRR